MDHLVKASADIRRGAAIVNRTRRIVSAASGASSVSEAQRPGPRVVLISTGSGPIALEPPNECHQAALELYDRRPPIRRRRPAPDESRVARDARDHTRVERLIG